MKTDMDVSITDLFLQRTDGQNLLDDVCFVLRRFLSNRRLSEGWTIKIKVLQPKTCPHLGLPGQSGGVQSGDTSGSEDGDGLSIVIHHLKVQVLVVLPPLHLST